MTDATLTGSPEQPNPDSLYATPQAIPAPSAPIIERPNLKPQSVAGEAIKGVIEGAVIGTVFSVTNAALGKITKGSWGPGPHFGKNVSSRILPDMFMGSTVLGLFGLSRSAAINDERDAARPYVEKLEGERESLVKDIIKNNSSNSR